MNNNKKTAIIIVSFNAEYLMKENIFSIRKTVNKSDYHIYVIDNASTDGIAEWLRNEAAISDDISVICNAENVGFPKACNQGVNLAISEGDTDSDIFLLNNDTRLCKNSLSNLKNALYSSDNVGAVGSISNYAGNNQQIEVSYSLPSSYVEFGDNNNIVATKENESELWEERVRLTGFAMLIKREVWNKAGGMDEAFSPGFIEDDDLSMKILMQGKRLLVCKNSFIYHAGSQSFSKVDNVNSLFDEHYKYFIEKYSIPIADYAYPKEYYLNHISYSPEEKINIAVIGSGLGADIKILRSRYKNARVIGIEFEDVLRDISSKTDEVYSNLVMAAESLAGGKLNVVIANNDGVTKLTEDDLSALDSLCVPDCVLLQESDESLYEIEVEEKINDEEVTYFEAVKCDADVVKYDAIIMVVPKDFERLKNLYPKLISTMPVKRILFVGNEEVGRMVENTEIEGLGFINENDILPFDTVHKVMKDALKERLNGQDLPRGITGWYYQQFLKMKYASICSDEYYLVWDGDTVPCKEFTMFSSNGKPLFDLKSEYHMEYFNTLSMILPGMEKIVNKSFISEHMLMKCEYMNEMISDIESNSNLKGDSFFEKIIFSINPDKLTSNSFSEFETYGTYCIFRHPDAYDLRVWFSFRYGGDFFDSNKITENDFIWLSNDFHAISFEKEHEVREDHKNLFDNKEYQAKLTARQMLEIAQEEFQGDSFIETWDMNIEILPVRKL